MIVEGWPMAQLVLYDNPIARDLISKPKSWNNLHDSFLPIFGHFTRPIYSYYLFFEYIGFKKQMLVKPNEEMFKFNNIDTQKRAIKEVDKIGLAYDSYFDNAVAEIERQLLAPEIKSQLLELIKNQSLYESNFENSKELKEILFGYILNLFFNDYGAFVHQAATHLAWDYFCNVSGAGITIPLLREAQLGAWEQSWTQNILLPFGKIIDDLEKYTKVTLSKNTRLDGQEDMVDAEAITYLIIGVLNKYNELEPINFLTRDNMLNIRERLQLGSENILNLEDALKIKIKKRQGRVYFLNDNMTIKDYEDVQITIPLQDLSKSILNHE